MISKRSYLKSMNVFLEKLSQTRNKIIIPKSLFESIKHINKYGEEFWYARELQVALEYKQWRRFKEVIDRAIIACKNSENVVSEHFVDVGKTIKYATNDGESDYRRL